MMAVTKDQRDEAAHLTDRDLLLLVNGKLDRLMPLADLLAQVGNGESSPLKMIAALMRGGS